MRRIELGNEYYNMICLTSGISQVIFDNILVVEHDAPAATSIKKPLHQLHLCKKTTHHHIII